MLTIDSLVHRYNDRVRIDYPDWHVDTSDHAMILGGSGSGKTTLLHLLAGLTPVKVGTVSIDGFRLHEMSASERDRFRGTHIGMVFQTPHLIKSLDVLHNLMLGQYLGKKKTDKQGALSMLDRLDIGALKGRKVHELSRGQAQRVSIARALLGRPKVLLADEPTASLDDVNCERVTTLLKEQAEQSEASLIIATHDKRVKGEFKHALTL